MEIQNTETSDLLNTAVLIWTLPHLPCDLSLKRVSYSPLADFFGCYILHLEIVTYYSKMTFCQKKIQRKINYKLTVPLFFDIKLYEDIDVRKCV